jgi:hypothetical protein
MTTDERMFFRSSNGLSSLSFLGIVFSPHICVVLAYSSHRQKKGEVCVNSYEISLRPSQGIDKLPKCFVVTGYGRIPTEVKSGHA